MVPLIGIALVLIAVALAIGGLVLRFRTQQECCTVLQTLAVWVYWDVVGVILVGGALLIRKG